MNKYNLTIFYVTITSSFDILGRLFYVLITKNRLRLAYFMLAQRIEAY